MFYCQQVNSGQGRRQEANYSLHGHEPIPHAAFVAVHVQVNSTLLFKKYKDMDKVYLIFQVAPKKLAGIKLQVNLTLQPLNQWIFQSLNLAVQFLQHVLCPLRYAI